MFLKCQSHRSEREDNERERAVENNTSFPSFDQVISRWIRFTKTRMYVTGFEWPTPTSLWSIAHKIGHLFQGSAASSSLFTWLTFFVISRRVGEMRWLVKIMECWTFDKMVWASYLLWWVVGIVLDYHFLTWTHFQSLIYVWCECSGITMDLSHYGIVLTWTRLWDPFFGFWCLWMLRAWMPVFLWTQSTDTYTPV